MTCFENLKRIVFLWLLVSVCIGSPAFGEISLPSAVELEKSLYFQNPAGEPVQFQPGIYEVEQNGEKALSMVPVGSDSGTTIQAIPAGHEEDVTANTAHLIPSPDNNADKQHLVFVTPDGLALESVGSYSGVFSRAALTWGEQVSDQEGATEELLTVEFEKQIYFKSAGGDPKAIQPGEYQVALSDNAVHLTAVDGKGESIAIEPESLGTSAAVVLPDLNDDQNLEMLMIGTVGGQSLVAIGSHDGTFPRGFFKKWKKKLKKKVSKAASKVVPSSVRKAAKRAHRIYRGKAARYAKAAMTGGASELKRHAKRHAKRYVKKYGRTFLKKGFYHGRRVLKKACGKRRVKCLAIAAQAAAAAS